MILAPGAKIGPYEVVTLLGAGGMGEVYRGRDTRLGRDVALKIISSRLVGDEASRHRFQREARAASALNHPAIVTVYDVGDTDGISWIAMEWVEGRTLREALAEGPLPLATARSIARQLADGLAVAHGKGVVHRDLKPENVMIAADGRVRILDFGLARQTPPPGFDSALAAAETIASPAATVDGVILGTVGYMSPEQAKGGGGDFRSDQFAFGLLLYEMLTGRRAFAGNSPIETLWATIREDPPPLASIRADAPSGLVAILSRCLAKDPDARFASTRDLADALVNDGSPGPGDATTSARGGDVALLHAAKRPVRTRAALAMVMTVVVIGLALALWKGTSPTARPIGSLAVLPFETRGAEADWTYLGVELAESLTEQMSRVPSLTVMARATLLRYKGTNDPLKAGRELKVGAVLTGTVSRRNDRLAIAAELVETATGARLWGRTYDTPTAELMQVQDDIVAEVSDRLRLGLSREDKRALGGQGTDDPEAYELFLRARHLLLSDSEEDDREARRLYEQAVAKDPRFVDAYLGIGSTYIRSAGNGYAPPAEAWAKAGEQMDKVRSLDPGNVGLRVQLATRRFLQQWDWRGAEQEFAQLAGDPRVLMGNRYHPIAIFFWARGWVDQSVALLERALRVDPGNLESRIMLADFLAHAGRLDDAIAYYRAITQAVPSDPRPLFGLSEVLKRKGDVAAAIDTLRTAYQFSGEEVGTAALAGAKTEKDYERAQMAVARSRQGELEELAKERYVSPLDLARVHAQAGERDRAFADLRRAAEERSPLLVLLKVSPVWDRLRDDRRFVELVRLVGIP